MRVPVCTQLISYTLTHACARVTNNTRDGAKRAHKKNAFKSTLRALLTKHYTPEALGKLYTVWGGHAQHNNNTKTNERKTNVRAC